VHTPSRSFQTILAAWICAFFLIGIPHAGWAQTTVCPGQEGEAAIQCIQTQYSPASTLGYDDARELMYLELDANASNEVSGIYSGYTVTITDTDDPIGDAFQQDVNAEHLYPQSKGASDEPQRSDLHSLYPARAQVNSARGNISFAPVSESDADRWYRTDTIQDDIPSNPVLWSQRDEQDGWQPRTERKGEVARAVLYFYTIYRQEANAEDDTYFETMRETLVTWNDDHAVTNEEETRMQEIASEQGNENPFVLDPTLAARTFGAPTGTSPTLALESDPVVGDDASEAELTVRYSNSDGEAASVDIQFDASNSTLSASDIGDFNFQTVTFSADASDGDTKTIAVPITGEATPGGEDEGVFELANLNASDEVSIGAPSTATLTLVDVSPPLVLNEVHYNPAQGTEGDANDDGVRDAFDDQFVELYNTSSSTTLDLSGYVHFDEDVFETGLVRHTFPNGTIVEPGESIVVFGGGDPADTIPGVVQTASSGRLSLANTGDSFTLRNSYDMDIISFTYQGQVAGKSKTRDPEFTGDFVAHTDVAPGELFSPGQTTDGDPLPVELSDFTVQTADEAATLQWTTRSETNNAGFEVQHQGPEAEAFASLGFVEGQGTTNERQTYTFETEALNPGTHRFRLQQRDTDGASTLTEPQTVDVQMQEAARLRVYPVPVREDATVQFAVDSAQEVTIEVYNALGQRVRTLHQGPVAVQQAETLQWRGSSLASGLYIVRLHGEKSSATQRITVVR